MRLYKAFCPQTFIIWSFLFEKENDVIFSQRAVLKQSASFASSFHCLDLKGRGLAALAFVFLLSLCLLPNLLTVVFPFYRCFYVLYCPFLRATYGSLIVLASEENFSGRNTAFPFALELHDSKTVVDFFKRGDDVFAFAMYFQHPSWHNYHDHVTTEGQI